MPNQTPAPIATPRLSQVLPSRLARATPVDSKTNPAGFAGQLVEAQLAQAISAGPEAEPAVLEPSGPARPMVPPATAPVLGAAAAIVQEPVLNGAVPGVVVAPSRTTVPSGQLAGPTTAQEHKAENLGADTAPVLAVPSMPLPVPPPPVTPKLPQQLGPATEQTTERTTSLPASAPGAARARPGGAATSALRDESAEPITAGQPKTAHSAAAALADITAQGVPSSHTDVAQPTSMPATAPDARPALPSPTPLSAPPPASGSAPTTPADQVAPALIAISAPAQPGVPQQITIRLDPTELGHVKVRIERSADGPAKVELAVERTDTLLLLLRDQPQLHRALDLAGVPQDGRTLHFSLAPPERSGPDSGTMSAGGGGADGGSARQHHSQPGGGGAQDSPAHPRRRLAWRRAGVDITA